MEISITYIISQIFTIIMYALLAVSYYAKERKKVLILSFLSLIANGIAYILLNAYSGLAMCALALVRNIIFIVDENKNGKREKITKKDIAILIILYAIAIISAVFTYEGFLSLFSIFATMLYTYSVWQKKTRVYKFLGIPIGILWMLYNFYIKSIFGVILEAILFICSVTGYILEVRKRKKEKN
ncbi:MAG: YgjV family protein [Clostridia bacterium]